VGIGLAELGDHSRHAVKVVVALRRHHPLHLLLCFLHAGHSGLHEACDVAKHLRKHFVRCCMILLKGGHVVLMIIFQRVQESLVQPILG